MRSRTTSSQKHPAIGLRSSAHGGYFITLCTHQREMLFGEIVSDDMMLNEYGHIVLDAWMETATIRPGVIVEEFTVKPNHFHAIVFLPNGTELDIVGAHPAHRAPGAPSGEEAGLRRAPKSLGALVAGFKSTVTTQINTRRTTPGTPVWQRNYHEHIIRNDEGLRRIREYIANTPAMWESDAENPSAPSRM